MSRAIVTNADDAENNNYIVNVPYLGDVSAQCATLDLVEVGTEVRIADLDNLHPGQNKSHGKLRFLPNDHPNQPEPFSYTYTKGGVWKTADDLGNTGNRAQLAKAYILASERNPRWQHEYPLYKRGKVTEIIDEKYMRVNILGDMNRKCRTDYMECDTAAFSEGDEAVVFYENGSFEKPVVVGFWTDPQPCYGTIHINDVFFRIGCTDFLGPGWIFANLKNMEWNVGGTWISHYNNTKYEPQSDEVWDAEQLAWIEHKTNLDVLFVVFWLNTANSRHGNWLWTNRPTQLRVTFDGRNANYIKRHEIKIDTYTLALEMTELLTSPAVIDLDWSGVPP